MKNIHTNINEKKKKDLMNGIITCTLNDSYQVQQLF